MEADSVNIRYFKEQVEKGIRDIFRAQKAIADSKIYNHERGQYHPDGSFTLVAQRCIAPGSVISEFQCSSEWRWDCLQHFITGLYTLSRHEAQRQSWDIQPPGVGYSIP